MRYNDYHNEPQTRRCNILRRMFASIAHSSLFIFLFSFFIPLSLALLSCSKAENIYSSRPVYFVCTNTNTIPQLNIALNSPGEFCAITVDASHFNYTSPSGSSQTNRTALQNYQNFRLGLSGLIVGLPNIPEPGADLPHVVCFDLACPNCFEQYSISPALTLTESGMARCRRCERNYDLNNQGIVASGTPGRALYRYRVSFMPHTLQVVNQ